VGVQAWKWRPAPWLALFAHGLSNHVDGRRGASPELSQSGWGWRIPSLDLHFQAVLSITVQWFFRARLVQPSGADFIGQALKIEARCVDRVLFGGLHILDEITSAVLASTAPKVGAFDAY
jgi:hypothetical protein